MHRFTAKIFKRDASQQQAEDESSRSSSPSRVSTVFFPDGVRVLHECNDATVDICFVHGLTGNRDTTWTAKGQSQPWPQTLLAPQLTRARILTYGYDAYVVKTSVASSNRLIDHSSNLLNDLTTDRANHNASSRPIVFVAHSLGGLVCKEAILLSRNNLESHLKKMFECTKGIIFMGTPHMGSWMADWAKLPASALGVVKSTNKSLLKILETDDQLLESVQVRFLAMIRDLRESNRRLEVTCFFEELPLPVVGKVVPKASATFAGYNPISIHANHSDMARFATSKDTGFKRVLGELTRWEMELRSPVMNEFGSAAEAQYSLSAPAPLFASFAAAGNVLRFVQLGTTIAAKSVAYIRNGGSLEQQRLQALVQKILVSGHHLLQSLERGAEMLVGARSKHMFYRANEQCLDLCKDFVNFLHRTKLSSSHDLMKLVRVALTRIKAEEEISRYQKRLEGVRTNLTLSFLVYVRAETGASWHHVREDSTLGQIYIPGIMQDSLDRMISSIEASFREQETGTTLDDFGTRYKEELKSLADHLDRILVPVSSALDTIRDIFEELLPCLDRDVSGRRKVIKSLFVEEMNQRRNNIKDAYGTTFRWFLQHGKNDPILKLSYLDWLEALFSENLFWIRGKAGSGKSTLMRYLNAHVEEYIGQMAEIRTVDPAPTWMAQKEILMASCYFWSSGSTVQKSYLGLLQSLLCQIFEARPWLVHSTTSDRRWETALFLEDNQHPWSKSELEDAFVKLFIGAKEECLILLMVDGLDEFQGSDTERLEMVQLFKAWTARPHVKMTVSSRPWIIYDEVFAAIPQLRLEELTKEDIKQFVYGSLYQDSTFRQNLGDIDLESV